MRGEWKDVRGESEMSERKDVRWESERNEVKVESDRKDMRGSSLMKDVRRRVRKRM